jgi:hypothetical protein
MSHTYNIPLRSSLKSTLFKLVAIASLQFSITGLFAQKDVSSIESPLEVLKLVGNKLVKETPFKYQLSLSTPNKTFNGIQVVDFGRTFGLGKPAVAYATTLLTASENTDLNIEIEHNDGCKIWLNGKIVYEKAGDRKINLVFIRQI